MKIAIIGTRGYPYVYGGFETFASELSERLVKNGVEVHIYCQKGLFKERPRQVNGIHLHYIPTVQTKSLNQIIHSFCSIIHASFSNIDLLLVVNLAAGPMGWIPKITGKKTLINVDGLEWLRPKWKGIAAKYFYFGAWCACKLYDTIITDAGAMQKIYLEEFNAESTVIAYGYPLSSAEQHTLDPSWNLHPQSYYLIVGRMIPDNNVHILINGFVRSGSVKKLVVVGDVPYADQYATELKKKASDQVIFLGYVTDSKKLLALYQNAFSYLHGHEFGGTNPAMLKAMSNNCAILALDTVFNREMLNDGTLGLFFDKNEQSLAKTINKLESEDNLPNNLRINVSTGLTDKYNWDRITEQYIREFKKLQNIE